MNGHNSRQIFRKPLCPFCYKTTKRAKHNMTTTIREEIKTGFDAAVSNYCATRVLEDIDTALYSIYSIMYGIAANKIIMRNYKSYMKEHYKSYTKSHKCVNGEDEEDDKYLDIIIENTLINIKQKLEERNIAYYEVRYESYPILITQNKDIVYVHMNFVCLTQEQKLPDWFEESIVFEEEDVHVYDYLVYDKDGFDTIPLEIKNMENDLDLNYNDDLPIEKIENFLNSDESGLVILNGVAGTGKSSLIRYLITNVDREFIYMDQSAFDSITDASFMRTLAEYENGVLILEDCESMLVGRMQGNSKITTLLNLTDGIIGDSFKFKVICTFNADIGQIDKALLRKGRLKIKYEFKKLTKEKTKRLCEHLGLGVPEGQERMTVADIYNLNYENGLEKINEKGIGFV